MPMSKTSASSRLIHVSNLHPDTFSPFGQVIQNPSAHNGKPEAVERAVANQGTAEKWIDIGGMKNWYEMGRSGKRARCVVNMFVCKPRQLEEREGRQVFPVKILERHPFTPQMFVPMGLAAEDRDTRYLVIVAPTLPLRSYAGKAKDAKVSSASDRRPAYPMPPPRPRRTLRERLLGARPNPFTNDYSPVTTPSANDSPRAASIGPEPKGPGLPDLDNLQAFIARGDQAVTYGPGTWHAPMVVLGEKAVEFVVVQHANGVAQEDCQEVEVVTSDDGDGLGVVVDEAATIKAKL